MTAIYNELDAFPAAWMRNLIAAGHMMERAYNKAAKAAR